MLKSGETIEIQLFVPDTGGKQTFGYNLEFEDAGNLFTDNFHNPAGRDFMGNALTPIQGKLVLAALLIGMPTVPDNGYIGTITLTAKRDIADGQTIWFKSVAMADQGRDEDLLDLSRSVVTFRAENYVEAIAGDLDRDGDVDFTDFLTFAGNYGKKGPKPSEGGRVITHTVIVRDTVLQHVRDTIRVEKVVLDTVTVDRTVYQTIHDTVRVSGDKEVGPFDGFYILAVARISTTVGVSLDLGPPAVLGTMTIQEPLISISFIATIGSASSFSSLGIFSRSLAPGETSVFIFDTTWNNGTSEKVVVLKEDNTIGVATSQNGVTLIMAFVKFEGVSTKLVAERELSPFIDRLDKMYSLLHK